MVEVELEALDGQGRIGSLVAGDIDGLAGGKIDELGEDAQAPEAGMSWSVRRSQETDNSSLRMPTRRAGR